MIIFGRRNMTSVESRGTFHCPRCGPDKSYSKIRVNRWFTLYFIPVIPLGTAGSYYQCNTCAGTYDASVLSYDPVAAQAQFRARFDTAAVRCLSVLALAQPPLTDATLDAMADIMSRYFSRAIEIDDLRPLVAEVERRKLTMKDILGPLAPSLNPAGKDLLLRGMKAFLAGGMSAKQRAAFEAAGNALGYRKKDLDAVALPAPVPAE